MKATENQKLYMREYYQRTKVERRAHRKQYNQEHKKAISERKRRYYLENIEKIRAYYSANREKQKEYRREHKVEYRAKSRKSYQKIKAEVISFYSKGNNICAYCGFTDMRALTIDHIGGGGNAHRKQIKRLSGGTFYCWLKRNNYPGGYQVLCANCQFIKRIVEGESQWKD